MIISDDEIEASRPVAASCQNGFLHVRLQDGREIGAPLWWYPRLATADADRLGPIELSPLGLHWPALDEDISVASILKGQKAPGAVPPAETKATHSGRS
jgi:hypothetical protein